MPLDAAAVLKARRALVDSRGVAEGVRFCEACAGGCSADGPNVSVEIFPAPLPGERPDHVAIGWKTYVYSLASLDFLATVIEENLRAPRREARPWSRPHPTGALEAEITIPAPPGHPAHP